LTANFSDIIVDKGVPIFVEKGAEYVINHFQPLFQKLHLDDIVEGTGFILFGVPT
jgi:hypothetical protein